MFKLIRRAFQSAFRDLGRPVSPATATGPATLEPPGDDDVLVGRRGVTPVYLGGTKRAMAQLKPVYTRSTRHSRPHPIEQGPRGRATDRKDFEPPPEPMVRPRAAGRGLPVLETPPQRAPYGLASGEEDPAGAPEARVQADRARGALPYSLTGRQLSG